MPTGLGFSFACDVLRLSRREIFFSVVKTLNIPSFLFFDLMILDSDFQFSSTFYVSACGADFGTVAFPVVISLILTC